MAEPSQENINYCYHSIFPPCSFRFFLFIYSPFPRTVHGHRRLAKCVCGDRPGTAFGIPCFHAKFPVICGAESSKEHSLLGIPGIPAENVAKNTALGSPWPSASLLLTEHWRYRKIGTSYSYFQTVPSQVPSGVRSPYSVNRIVFSHINPLVGSQQFRYFSLI